MPANPVVAAVALLAALRQAGCEVWLEREPDDPGDRELDLLIVSPPGRHIDWPGDAEAAIETFYDELRTIVRAEDARTAH